MLLHPDQLSQRRGSGAVRSAARTRRRSWRSAAPSAAHNRAMARPFQAETPTSPRNCPSSARTALASRLVARRQQHGRDRDSAVGDCRVAKFRGRRTVKAQRLAVNEPAAATQPPAVREFALSHRFAHGGAAEHDRLCEEEARIGSKVDLDRAPQFRPIEQDRLLRQPGECSAIADREAHVDFRGRGERAIDLLGRRGGDDEVRARSSIDVDRETVAARDPAGGVDEHCFELRAGRSGTAHPQRAVLVHARAAADAVASVQPSARPCQPHDCRRKRTPAARLFGSPPQTLRIRHAVPA